MLWPVLLFALVMKGTSNRQNTTHSSNFTDQQALRVRGTSQDNATLLLRPKIHYCRSPNKETFTCWWHFPDNSSHGNDNITSRLTYSVGNGPTRECPDYVTGGENSCYFDSHHTQVWEIYCMNVVVHSRRGNYTSEDHCLDVDDIVETDPPFNLTYWVTNSSEEGSGRSAVVSWLYPNAADVHMGWMTLVFELQYRRQSAQHSWKVKGALREPRLELMHLAAGSYLVRVRCKSHTSKLWSKWSELLTINIPPHQTIDKKLAIVLVTAIGITAFLLIGFWAIPRGKRIKAFLLPPVPKPRIRGIDPVLLKNGRMDEITRLFKSFHGYSPPQYSAESWLHVTTDEGQSLQGSHVTKGPEKAGGLAPSDQRPVLPGDQGMQQASTSHCKAPFPAPGATPPHSSALGWPSLDPRSPELLLLPNRGYTVALSPAPASGFYACVNRVNTCGGVQLVPCASAHNTATPPLRQTDSTEKGGPEGEHRPVVRKDKQTAPPADMSSVISGGVTGPTGAELGGCYTTMDAFRGGGV